ncbi:SRPBCC family protein [Conexibacter sp. W3-3-2]|uniref:SRPBCC family protein n=1 Tax=Conexibacter sp. W3-3-2 TaxID=2675227 RepID=UPI0012B9946C|nr:SRPBCC family protein [Conexibacter sp. W3-3-2]MTD44598.1 SRPBCC family protein [Conexibacter sp. W3-3-2]
MQKIAIEHDFTVPVERAYAFLSEHENLSTLFPAKVTRVKDGDDGTRNGVGSVRKLQIAILPPFEETNTKVVENELVEYRITKGSPLRDHQGRMTFSARPDGGSHLRYEIEFRAVVPGLDAIVAKALKRDIAKGLAKVDHLA